MCLNNTYCKSCRRSHHKICDLSTPIINVEENPYYQHMERDFHRQIEEMRSQFEKGVLDMQSRYDKQQSLLEQRNNLSKMNADEHQRQFKSLSSEHDKLFKTHTLTKEEVLNYQLQCKQLSEQLDLVKNDDNPKSLPLPKGTTKKKTAIPSRIPRSNNVSH
jgi:hypothetical protein